MPANAYWTVFETIGAINHLKSLSLSKFLNAFGDVYLINISYCVRRWLLHRIHVGILFKQPLH